MPPGSICSFLLSTQDKHLCNDRVQQSAKPVRGAQKGSPEEQIVWATSLLASQCTSIV